MAFITRIETAQELKGLFGEYNRDQYEMCTYDGELSEDEIQIVVDYVSENTCLICSDGETIAYLAF